MLKLIQTRNLSKNAAAGWKDKFFEEGAWIEEGSSRSRAATYDLLIAAAEDPQKIEEILGTESWTKVYCASCGKYKATGVLFKAAEAVICNDCISMASFLCAEEPETSPINNVSKRSDVNIQVRKPYSNLKYLTITAHFNTAHLEIAKQIKAQISSTNSCIIEGADLIFTVRTEFLNECELAEAIALQAESFGLLVSRTNQNYKLVSSFVTQGLVNDFLNLFIP
jgi:hypothetical protein